MQTSLERSWWVFVAYGGLAILCGIAMLMWPARSVVALAFALGLLALADGVVSLLSLVRKDTALPNWALILYAVLSLLFGTALVMHPAAMAEALLWLLAAWLIIAGIARIVFAMRARRHGSTEWTLIVGGLVVAALGIALMALPGLGLAVIAFWAAIALLIYGTVQVLGGLRLRKEQLQVA